MHKNSSIIAGLIIFVGLVSYPFWSNLGRSEGFAAPVLPTEYTECVESREFMRNSHMKLLDHWRDEVVRETKHVYVNSKGVKFNKSLSKTCLNCHDNKEEFCDRCHNSVGVKNYCWDCHNTKAPDGVSPFYTEPATMEEAHGESAGEKTLIQQGVEAAKGVMHQ